MTLQIGKNYKGRVVHRNMMGGYFFVRIGLDKELIDIFCHLFQTIKKAVPEMNDIVTFKLSRNKKGLIGIDVLVLEDGVVENAE